MRYKNLYNKSTSIPVSKNKIKKAFLYHGSHYEEYFWRKIE